MYLKVSAELWAGKLSAYTLHKLSLNISSLLVKVSCFLESSCCYFNDSYGSDLFSLSCWELLAWYCPAVIHLLFESLVSVPGTIVNIKDNMASGESTVFALLELLIWSRQVFIREPQMNVNECGDEEITLDYHY